MLPSLRFSGAGTRMRYFCCLADLVCFLRSEGLPLARQAFETPAAYKSLREYALTKMSEADIITFKDMVGGRLWGVTVQSKQVLYLPKLFVM